MYKQYPDNVTNKILQITLQTQTFAYLAIDKQGMLINQGGQLDTIEIQRWKNGDNILAEALFLTGLFPLTNDYEYISSYQLNDKQILDIHLFKDIELDWIIMVDKTDELEWQSKARQKSNELRLLQQGMVKKTKNRYFDFFEALSLMALRMNDDGSFELLEPVAPRFFDIYPELSNSRSSLYPQEKFIFIENFLIDARELWNSNNNHKRIRSGPWIEHTPDDGELALEAIALNWDDNKLLFVEIQDETYQQNLEFLQIGRDGALFKNVLEKEIHKRTEIIRAREEEIALRLVSAADSKDDGETGDHIRRLGLYSQLMAKHLGWGQNEIDEIRIAAPMHDIGKIGIPDHILTKPGKLTKEEFEIMKKHPEIGSKILSNSKSPLIQMASDISLGHHEKWDGSGYPYGLSGEDISISARIVAIVDVFDALIHKRVYKDKLPIDEAMAILKEGRGKHFDPDLLDLFLELKKEMILIAKDFVEPIYERPDSVWNEPEANLIHAILQSEKKRA